MCFSMYECECLYMYVCTGICLYVCPSIYLSIYLIPLGKIYPTIFLLAMR